jgi:hypothetical protein
VFQLFHLDSPVSDETKQTEKGEQDARLLILDPVTTPTTPAFGHPSSGRRGVPGSDLISQLARFSIFYYCFYKENIT